MNRFWVSWWSGYYDDEGCTKPPFQVWNSGSRDRFKPGTRQHDENRDECSWCAVIDADSEDEIWRVVKQHFPDYERRFCESQEPDWEPNDRFPDFKNETSLVHA